MGREMGLLAPDRNPPEGGCGPPPPHQADDQPRASSSISSRCDRHPQSRTSWLGTLLPALLLRQRRVLPRGSLRVGPSATLAASKVSQDATVPDPSSILATARSSAKVLLDGSSSRF